MPKDKKIDFDLPPLDDIFSTQADRDEAKLKRIFEIPLSEIDPFPDHPFKVKDDEDMMNLKESVKANGIITPATLRKKEDGRYELISGHRRMRACELAGLETLRSEIVDMSRDEAIIFMVESNFQRTQILPSEKAFAYKMRLEAMKRMPGRPLNGAPVEHNLKGMKSRDMSRGITLSADEMKSLKDIIDRMVPELRDPALRQDRTRVFQDERIRKGRHSHERDSC